MKMVVKSAVKLLLLSALNPKHGINPPKSHRVGMIAATDAQGPGHDPEIADEDIAPEPDQDRVLDPREEIGADATFPGPDQSPGRQERALGVQDRPDNNNDVTTTTTAKRMETVSVVGQNPGQ